MELTTQHCPCGAYVMAVFHNGTLREVTLNHYTRAGCTGQTEHLDPGHYWEPDIPTALADRREPGADLRRDHIMKYRDPSEPEPVRRWYQPDRRKRLERATRRR